MGVLEFFGTDIDDTKLTPPKTWEEIAEFIEKSKKTKTTFLHDAELFASTVQHYLQREGVKEFAHESAGSMQKFFTGKAAVYYLDEKNKLPKTALKLVKKFKSEAVAYFDKPDREPLLLNKKVFYMSEQERMASIYQERDKIVCEPIVEIDLNQAYLTQAKKKGFCSPATYLEFNEILPAQLEVEFLAELQQLADTKECKRGGNLTKQEKADFLADIKNASTKKIKKMIQQKAAELATSKAKKARLIALGTLAKSTTTTYTNQKDDATPQHVSNTVTYMQEKEFIYTTEVLKNKNGDEIQAGQIDAFSHLIEKVTNTHRETVCDIFFYCASEVTKLLNSIMYELGDGAFFYWVDAIFLKKEYQAKAIEMIEAAGFKYKIKEWDGIKRTSEALWEVYWIDEDDGELKPAKKFQFKKRNQVCLDEKPSLEYWVNQLAALYKEHDANAIAKRLCLHYQREPKKAQAIVSNFQKRTGYNLGDICKAVVTFKNQIKAEFFEEETLEFDQAAATIQTIEEIFLLESQAAQIEKGLNFAEFLNLAQQWAQSKDSASRYNDLKSLQETRSVDIDFLPF